MRLLKLLIFVIVLVGTFWTLGDKPVFAQSCGGGQVNGAYHEWQCTPTGCNPALPGCNCGFGCRDVTLAEENCQDYNTCNSCVSVNFSGYDCGNRGRCNWGGSFSCGSPTNTPPPSQFCGDNICNNGEWCGSCPQDCGVCAPTNTPQPGATNTPPPSGVCTPNSWGSPSCGNVNGCGGCDSSQCNSSGTGWNCVSNPGLCCIGVTPIPTAVPIDPLPIGYQDDPVGATCTLYGWTCDPSRYAQALSVHVYLNGTTFVGSATADDPNEPAVTALCGGTEPHRWHLNLPLSYRDGLNHSFNSYAIGIDPSGAPNGYNPELNSSPRTINCPLCSSPIPPVNVSNTSACFGSGGLTGSVQVNWGSGTYDVVRRLGAGAPVIIAPARSATHTDLTAACGSTYTYGVQTPAGACGASAIKWAPTAVTVKCNPAPPGRPTAGNVAFGYVDVTDVSNGDNVYRALVPAPGAAPAPPYSQWVGVVIGGRVRDLSANCNPPPQNHYYQARASRGLGANICYADSPPSNAGSCLVSSDWYQTNGNVTANGTVSNAVPITFTTIGLITATNASSVTWGGPLLPVNQFAATAIHSSVVPNNSFATFYNSARTKAGTITPSTATSLIANSATGPIVDGVTYAEYNGGSLNLSATTMTKNMVLIYSGSGDVTITGNITVGTGANTFVLLAKRDIYVDSSVGAASDPSQAVHGDNLQGIYFAGRTFYDKTAADPGGNTLRINGTVIGMGGVVMERVSTINWPKDYFVFNPGYVMNLPTGLRFSTRFFNELAP